MVDEIKMNEVKGGRLHLISGRKILLNFHNICMKNDFLGWHGALRDSDSLKVTVVA